MTDRVQPCVIALLDSYLERDTRELGMIKGSPGDTCNSINWVLNIIYTLRNLWGRVVPDL